MREIWKPIPGFMLYEASNKGEIRNGYTKTLLTQHYSYSNPKNYYCVKLIDNSGRNRIIYTHKLICAAFHGPQPMSKNGERVVAEHLNDKKHDNRPENLKWSTQSKNMYAALKSGLRQDNVEVVVFDVKENKKYKYHSILELARVLKMDRFIVYRLFGLYNSEEYLYQDRYYFWCNIKKLERYNSKDKPFWAYDCLKDEWVYFKSAGLCSLVTGMNISTICQRRRLKDTNMRDGYVISENKLKSIPYFSQIDAKIQRDFMRFRLTGKNYIVIEKKTGNITPYVDLVEVIEKFNIPKHLKLTHSSVKWWFGQHKPELRLVELPKVGYLNSKLTPDKLHTNGCTIE